MFDQIFKDRHALARHENGPLAEERRRYLAHCADQQMSHETLRGTANYVLNVARAMHLDERPGEVITRAEIDVVADRWAHRPRQPRKDHRTLVFTGHAIRWLSFLGRLQQGAPVDQPYADHVAQFTNYERRERGFTLQTVAYCARTLHEFFTQMAKAKLRLNTLTVPQVDELLAKKVHEEGYARSTIQRWATVLRTFFRFAEGRGWCRSGLAAAIMAPRAYRHAGLPIGPSWDDVKRLLAGAEGDRPTDIRDRAMMMLLAVYGLRAGEVTALRLKDFDWEREILTVPYGKAQRPRTYPLCRAVGDAVLRYLYEVRPRSDRREVFFTLIAPFHPLAPDGLGEVVRRRLHALGLKLPHYGSHVLRHACATHLLEQGLSLKEIGDHLGHRSPQATEIYAKVDMAALRTVADFDLEGLV